jgi:hypothetical protein
VMNHSFVMRAYISYQHFLRDHKVEDHIQSVHVRRLIKQHIRCFVVDDLRRAGSFSLQHPGFNSVIRKRVGKQW